MMKFARYFHIKDLFKHLRKALDEEGWPCLDCRGAVQTRPAWRQRFLLFLSHRQWFFTPAEQALVLR